MVKKVIWSKRALRERKEILAYWNWRKKVKCLQQETIRINTKCDKDKKLFPEIGISTTRPDTRLKIVRDYFIMDKIQGDRILILSF